MEETAIKSTRIRSSAFKNGEMIPAKYTCDGKDINPPINISGIPEDTLSLVLIVEDPDAPSGVWDHWLMWNIPVDGRIEENSAPGIQGENSSGRNQYHGPCPGSGKHRYFFRLYALDTSLDLEEGTSKEDLKDAMRNHILAEAELMGLYERKK